LKEILRFPGVIEAVPSFTYTFRKIMTENASPYPGILYVLSLRIGETAGQNAERASRFQYAVNFSIEALSYFRGHIRVGAGE